jgi:hypothetical protein
MRKKSTLDRAWQAFESDLLRHEKRVTPAFRQAFKNGAARVVAMHEIPWDDVELVQRIGPWVLLCLDIHPDWTERHRDCMLAGGLAAATILRGGESASALVNDIKAFEVGDDAQED